MLLPCLRGSATSNQRPTNSSSSIRVISLHKLLLRGADRMEGSPSNKDAARKPRCFCFFPQCHYRNKAWSDRRALDEQYCRQRGLLNYQDYDVSELQPFMSARKPPSMPTRTGKRALAEILADADDQTVFGPFVDLPLGLRMSIYALHWKSLK